MFSKLSIYREHIWIEFNTLQSQPILELKPLMASVINFV